MKKVFFQTTICFISEHNLVFDVRFNVLYSSFYKKNTISSNIWLYHSTLYSPINLKAKSYSGQRPIMKYCYQTAVIGQLNEPFTTWLRGFFYQSASNLHGNSLLLGICGQNKLKNFYFNGRQKQWFQSPVSGKINFIASSRWAYK